MPVKKDTPALPTQAEVEKALAPYVAELSPIIIQTDEDYTGAGAELRHLKTEQKAVTAMKTEALKPVAELRDTITSWFAPALERLAGREQALKKAIGVYDSFKEAERRRIEAELRDQHAKEVAAALAEADRLAEADQMEAAEAILDEMPMIPTVISAKPKLSGISTRELWHAEVTDFTEFLCWCIDNSRLDLLQANDQALQAHARMTKGGVPIEGVHIWMEKSLAARSA